MKKLSGQSGFTAVEALLVFVLVGIIGGTGYYVWHAQQNVSKTNTDTDYKITTGTAKPKSSVNTSTTRDSSASYLVIKEWGVQAVNKSKLTLRYYIKDNAAWFYSQELADATHGGCKEYGGIITRYRPNDTYESDPKSRPINVFVKDSSIDITYKQIGDFYYLYEHSHSLCADINPSSPNFKDLENLQTQTNDAVKAMLLSLKAV
jgi:hypothetical protein